MSTPINEKVLDAVVAIGESETINSMGHTNIGMTVKATAVTDGGAVKLQGSVDGSTWYDLATDTVTGNGTTNNVAVGYHPYLRVNVTARTDGTYTVNITASGFAGTQ